ncbi:phosphate ABC transporter, permease protein PstA [Corynebacterium sp. CMW7794]|uniref:Phosphate transport system permease protein PstA n=1 Tax=Corynebacterium phoceense TaxID=1686286 RepID=A0A540R9S1_9CORY|nr:MULTISPECIES: phosphate ABC transporter permease PstA [Corynebacterium]KXB54782.1 phosphate ABC transporter, permease protein PstA [Corynebacterium sp. DNF00584]KXI19818.1 phosphate ABC transporter, permease protein PstA [Corynebacterium sp. CMW7794]MBF9010832.1 phosphate ABC transporter permease PstA [Corynebacterium phoceense]MCQ9331671.1 phosphate ABC transporter permease PstA [Corynebacterium phoceense]MCQ9341621.1 phosphate ABC transporter permease PstA [Corynebacterium phoceense]
MTTTTAIPVKNGSAFQHISGSRKIANSIATAVVWGAMIIAMIPLVWVLWELIARGSGVIFSPEWWTTSQRGIMNTEAGGGALHAIIGTFVQTLFATLISVPIGIFTAIYLVEYSKGGFLGRMTTFMVDILSGVPSIVAALFVFAMWITLFGFDRSGFAVALSLVLLMIPLVVRNTEEMLRVVPMDLREASYALGVPKWKTIARIVLPTALSGIVTGIMLAVARVMGESAPVLVLVGSSSSINWDSFKGPQSSLPLMMLDMYKAGAQPAVLDKLWGAALTLVILIAVLNVAARWVSAKFSVKK